MHLTNTKDAIKKLLETEIVLSAHNSWLTELCSYTMFTKLNFNVIKLIK